MAEYPTTNINSQLIGEGLNPNNPTGTYVDFANQLVKNQQEQAAQEQAIARATELAKQAQLQTRQGLSAEQAGYNPLLANSMTPDQAVAYVKLVVKEKGLTIDQADLDAWKATLPERVEREEVMAFANRFAKPSIRPGVAAKFTTDMDLLVPAGKSAADIGLTDMKDAEGTSVDDKTVSDGTFVAHVPESGMYQADVDNTGVLQHYTPGGKEPVDQTAKNNAKSTADTERQWQKLDAAVNSVVKQGRGNQLAIAIARSDRALNELASPEVLVPQVLQYIGKDLSGIFQGGVQPVSGMEGENFETAYQQLNAFVQKYTGVSGFFKTDVGNQREFLLRLITRLRDGSLDMLEKLIAAKEAGYKAIIDADPERWQKMVNDYTAANTAGLTATAAAATKAAAASPNVEPIPGIKIPNKKVVPKYTVEE